MGMQETAWSVKLITKFDITAREWFAVLKRWRFGHGRMLRFEGGKCSHCGGSTARRKGLAVAPSHRRCEVRGPAATVADAQRLVVEQKPDLAVVDINLKGEMAYALIDQLHDQGVRVVVMSGYAVLPRLTDKVAAVLQKPFNGPELLSVLCRVLAL